MARAYRIERFTDHPIQLTTSKVGLYTYIGPDIDTLASKVSAWCSEQGSVKGDIETPLRDLLQFARTRYFRADHKAVWFEMRLALSNSRYSIPRPHMDGPFWSSELDRPVQDAFRVGAVLCGPATLFWDVNSLSEEVREKANWVVNNGVQQKREDEGLPTEDYIGSNTENDYKLRTWMVKQLEELGVKVRSASIGEAIVWNVRTSEVSAIHSEPDMSHMPEGRIFVSTMPGTEEQIKALCQAREHIYGEVETSHSWILG